MCWCDKAWVGGETARNGPGEVTGGGAARGLVIPVVAGLTSSIGERKETLEEF